MNGCILKLGDVFENFKAKAQSLFPPTAFEAEYFIMSNPTREVLRMHKAMKEIEIGIC